MSYQVRVISPKFSGEGRITQLVNFVNMSGLDLDGGFHHGFVLDGEVIYPTSRALISENPDPQGDQNLSLLDDSPEASGSLGEVHIDADFRDYVMFRPYGGAGNISVTLAEVTWSIRGYSFYPSDTIQSNSVTGPNGPVDSTAFPEWTDVHWNPW